MAIRISITTWMFIVVPSLALVLPGGPSAAGLVVDHIAAMKALLTPLMFIVKTPCSIAE